MAASNRVGSPGNEVFMHETAQGKITLVGALDPDPVLSFGSAVIDFGAPSSFSFTFILPLDPDFPNPSVVSDSFSGSLTNGSGSTISVTPLPPPSGIPTDSDGIPEMQVYTLSDDEGATWQNVGLDLGPAAAFTVPPNSATYGPFAEGPIPTIAGGPWTHMRADINFSLSGGGDIFTFNGEKTLLVPEPGTFALVLISLGACCFSRRRSVR